MMSVADLKGETALLMIDGGGYTHTLAGILVYNCTPYTQYSGHLDKQDAFCHPHGNP